MLTALFWMSAALIAYVYLIFPAVVLVRGSRRARSCSDAGPWKEPEAVSKHLPRVSLVVVAHNEAAAMALRLENILALDYPSDRLEVLVASDGSTDETDNIVRRFADRGVRLLSLPREGKISALNAAVARTEGEILAFSDANSIFPHDALRALVRPFSDPEVGGVAGDQRYLKDNRASNQGERAYWDFDRWMKRAESAAGSTISATGAIYAIRRSLFQRVPPGVTDDFSVSTGVIAQGYRLVLAPEAVAYEPVAQPGRREFGRKVRVITRGLRGVIARRALLNPLRHGFYAVEFLSHKILRRLVVFPLLLLLLASVALWPAGGIYRIACIVQLAFYGSAAAGWLLAGTRWERHKLLSIPCFFCLVNAAALVATINVLRGRRIDLWEPQRQPSGGRQSGDRSLAAASREGSMT